MIVGQDKLLNIINSCSLDTLPRTIMLLGSEGSGKKTISRYISSKFHLILSDITDDLTLETIEEIMMRVEPHLYIIRANEISVKEQNVILKFLEEPLKNSYILMLCERTEGLLPTIVNRCQMWALQNYSRETLKSFLTVADERILDIVDTPGLIISLQSHDFNGMIELADKIVDKIAVASIPNTLTLSNKLAFKNEKDKFDVNLFMRILSSRISEAWKSISNIKLITAHNLTSELQHKLNISNVDKKSLFEKYLIDLRTCMRGSVL